MSMVKNNFVVIIISIFCLSMFIFIVTSYVNAQSNITDNNTVIKIPPPIVGLELPKVNEAQKLEKTEVAILTSDGSRHKYTVELAITPEEQRIGMMFRDYIDENTGMLFVFKEAAERAFWMKNTLIPLDLIFIRSDGIIVNIHHMAEEGSLKRISSNGKAMAVLEIAGGEAEILGINIGDRILYEDF